MKTKVKPCPFCASHDVEIVQHQTSFKGGSSTVSYIQCKDCGSKGPELTSISHDGEKFKNIKKETYKNWNMRFQDQTETDWEDELKQEIEDTVSIVSTTLKEVADKVKSETDSTFTKENKEKVKNKIIDLIKKV